MVCVFEGDAGNSQIMLWLFTYPVIHEERIDVVRHAYVGVKRHLKHVDPIDRIIRASRPVDSDSQVLIFDTEKPSEIKSKLRQGVKLRNQLLLLIGSVGSGKKYFYRLFKRDCFGRVAQERHPLDLDSMLVDSSIYQNSKRCLWSWRTLI